MVRFKLLAGIMNFLILVIGFIGCYAFFNRTCYKCKETYWYAQLTDDVVFGLLIESFLVCLSIMLRERIPWGMHLLINFSSALLYAMVAGEMIYLYKSLQSMKVLYGVSLGIVIVLALLHFVLGFLYAFRSRLTGSPQ